MSKVEELRLLTTVGFKVVRLRPNSKIPANKDWQQLATNDLETINKWGSRCNYGVLTGTKISKSHRFIVLDVDNKNGNNGSASYQRLKSDFNLTDTVYSKSPNGGEHHYYLVPAELSLTSISTLLKRLEYPGIDLLGEGLQVLESPSQLFAEKYQWVRPPSTGIESLSISLQAVLTANGRKSKTSRVPRKSDSQDHTVIAVPRSDTVEESNIVKKMIIRFPISHPGQRNQQQTKVVGHLFSKNYSQPLIRSVALQWLENFEDKVSTHLEEAKAHVDSCIASTHRKVVRGKFALAVDHEKLISEQDLSRPLEKLLFSFCHHLQEVKNDKMKRTKTSLSLTEKNFIRLILLFCQYQVCINSRASEIPLTDLQIRQVWKELYGGSIDSRQNERFKKKFFSRPVSEGKSRKAQKLELLTMKSKGTIGIPSLYVPCTKLETALNQTLRRKKFSGVATNLVRRAN